MHFNCMLLKRKYFMIFKWLSSFFLFIFFQYPIFSQVVNIENKRFLNDTNGWVGRVDFGFNLTQNTQQIITFNNSVRAQYQKNKSRFLILNELNFIQAAGKDFVNSGFQHFRYSYKVKERITAESFVQTQYNPILRLNLRFLIGAGPRFKLIKKERFKLYAATLYMYEYEEILKSATNYDHRLSSYVTFAWSISKQMEWTATTFYQPNIQNFSDYRIAHDGALEIAISKHFSFLLNTNVLFDTKQPEGIPELTYTIKNGVSFKF
jgi:putative salt-induced outer membrane protein YdiY